MISGIVRHNPTTMYAPVGGIYSQGVEIPPGARLLYFSGVVGADINGVTPESCAAQFELTWINVNDKVYPNLIYWKRA